MMTENLSYHNSEGCRTELKECSLTKSKNGRFYLWSEALKQNLAYNIQTREDAFLAAINSLLFIVELKEERIAELQRVYNLASELADMIKPDEESE